jgi:hypothetical protein
VATATTLRKRKSKSAAARQGGEETRLRPENKRLLRWLDSWLSAPDDRGEAWWTEFEADLQDRPVTFRPSQVG